MENRGKFLWICCIVIFSIMGGPAWGADNFPTRPLELIVPYGPGGATDVMCRTLVARAAPYFNNQTVLVVNKPGGSTIVASRYVLDNRNDGYTLYSTSAGSMMVAPVVNKANLSWRDFTGIAQVYMGANALFVLADSPINTIENFIDYAKKNPGKIKYTSAGVGGVSHLAMEGFGAAKGLVLKHIPTKGDSDAIISLLGGHVMAATGDPSPFNPHVASGKFKCLVQFSGERVQDFAPDVPTFKELGIDVVVDLWRWVIVPKGVPPERVKFLDEAFKKTLQDQTVLDSLKKIQSPVSYRPAEDYEKAMKESEDALMPLIKLSRIMEGR